MITRLLHLFERRRRKKYSPTINARNVAAREHRTAQESPRDQPRSSLSLSLSARQVGSRSLANESSSRGGEFFLAMLATRGQLWWSVTWEAREETWGSTRVRGLGTLVVHWCAETAPNDCRVGDAVRRLPSNPHHAAAAPTTDSSRVGKMGGKVVGCMIGRLLDRHRSKGRFWFYLHCVDTFAGGWVFWQKISRRLFVSRDLSSIFWNFNFSKISFKFLASWNI